MSDWSYAKEEPVTDNSKTQFANEWSYAEDMPEESFLQKLPRNVGIGLGKLAQSVANSPYDISQNLKHQGQKWDEEMKMSGLPVMPRSKFNLADYIPHNPEMNFEQTFGQRGEPTWADYGIQKGIEFGPEILGGTAVAKNALKGVIPHLTQKGAAKTLSQAKKLATERNIAPIKIDPKLIKEAGQFLPKTSAYKNALKEAKTGDYNSLFKLQTDLGKHAGEFAGSKFSAAERAHGQAGLGTRKNILNEMHKGLQAQGHGDISKLLREGQKEYARYMKIKPIRNKAIKYALGGAAVIGLPQIPIINHLLKDMILSGIK